MVINILSPISNNDAYSIAFLPVRVSLEFTFPTAVVSILTHKLQSIFQNSLGLLSCHLRNEITFKSPKGFSLH